MVRIKNCTIIVNVFSSFISNIESMTLKCDHIHRSIVLYTHVLGSNKKVNRKKKKSRDACTSIHTLGK